MLMAVFSHLSMLMYVKTRNMMPTKLDDTWEVAYVLFGRKSFFVICGVLCAHAWIIVVVTYCSAAGTLTSITYHFVAMRDGGYASAPAWQQWFCDRTNWLYVGFILRLPMTFQRQRDDFWAYSYILRLLVFIGAIYAQLIRGNTARGDEDIDVGELMRMNYDGYIICGFLLIIVCFTGTQWLAIPSYCELEDTSP